ncbi:MAG: hypothetical protein HOH43_09795 [Candidatus Latescibacteria bacterium]|nr:hypothetical protein [Candidatus Latescibacterota bacterium]
MKHNESTDDLLRRHRKFWEMDDVDSPLMSVGRYVSLQNRDPIPMANGKPVQDGEILLPAALRAIHLMEQSNAPDAVVQGDFIRGRSPYDLCWTEAISGCQIRWRAGHIWADPFIEDLNEVEHLQANPDSEWLSLLLELTRLLAEAADGAYPVTQPLMRGPIDIASAIVGDEPLCWEMVDEPNRFRLLMRVSTDLFITIAKAWRDAAPLFAGGSCLYGIWAPGTAVRIQADNAALMSPGTYRDFLLPCDERICAAFDYPLMHTHSGVLHIIADALLELDGLRAIQVSLDYPAPPPISELLPVLQKVNGRKPLIITGSVTQSELDSLLDALSPAGLCLQVALRDG